MLTANQSSVESATGTFSVSTALAVVNAVLTSFATSASPSTVTVFTGSLAGNVTLQATGITPGTGAVGRSISVTTASNAGTYKIGAANGIVVNGTDYNGAVASETLVLTQVNGGETVVGKTAWKTITSIVIPGQNNTSGSWQFGVQDVVMPQGCRTVRISNTGTAGNLHVGYPDGSTDVIPGVAVGEYIPARPSTVYGDSLTTAVGLTFFF